VLPLHAGTIGGGLHSEIASCDPSKVRLRETKNKLPNKQDQAAHTANPFALGALLLAIAIVCGGCVESGCAADEFSCANMCVPTEKGHALYACVNGVVTPSGCLSGYQRCGATIDVCIPNNLVCCGTSGVFCLTGTTCCNGNQCCSGGTCDNNGCGTNFEDCQGNCWATLQECQGVSCGGGSSCKQCP
jgi:hypothetical protein